MQLNNAIVVLAFIFSFVLSGVAMGNDRPANGGFSFLKEGSLVIEFYRDQNPPTLHADKYVVFRMHDGDVYTADTEKCAHSDCWVRKDLKRKKGFPSLRDFFTKKYGSESETRWQVFRADTQTILKAESLNGIATAKDRYYLSRSTRVRLPLVMDPAPGVSFTLYLLEECDAPVWGMLREIYDIDGGRTKKGTAVVSESFRMLTQASGHQNAQFQVAIKRVTLIVRDYLNQYFSNKKD